MAGYPPPYPPPGPPYGPPNGQDWKYQRRLLRDQAKAQRDQYRYQMRSMRRGSILGPIFVVLVGVVFLLVQTGRLRGDHLWTWYGRWWPLLLVFAGVILLIEWAVDQARPRDPQVPYVRRSVGGGVIFMIVLVALAGAVLGSLHDGRDYFGRKFSIDPENMEQLLGNKHESDEARVQQLPLGSALTIDNPRGDVFVSGSSSDGTMHVSLHKQVYSRSDSDAERKAHELSPGIATRGKHLSISVPTMTGAVSDLTLTIPSATSVTINANHGDVHVNALKSPLTVTANHGDVTLSSITGAVTARVNNGGSSFSAHSITGPVALEGHGQDLTVSDINGPVSLSGDFYGTTHLEHITNAVKFHTSRTDFQLGRLDGEMEISPDADLSADQAVGPVVLTTRNRNITLERISGDLTVTNRNGSVDLTSAPPLGNVTVQNRNGSVNLTLPDRANFALTADTTDGELRNDFGLPNIDHDQKVNMTGTVGKGGSLIRISTSQGDVDVKKASIAPLPVAAPRPPSAPASPQVNIQSEDGSSVYVGSDGVRVTTGADGSSVIIGKDGVHITANADGSTVYRGKDGTRLTENADGSKVFIGRDGLHYTEGADGGKIYKGSDGTTIVIGASGSRVAKGAGGSSLSSEEVESRLRRAQDDIRQAEHQRHADQEANKH